MFKYTVTVEANTENAFWTIQLGEDGYTDFEKFDDDGNEIHTVYAEKEIDTQLDQKDNIISYTVEER